jgi:hypothetical protein
MKAVNLANPTYQRVMELLGQGKSQVEIAQMVELSTSMVNRVKKYSESIIISEFEGGKKIDQIIEEHGIPPIWVYQVLARHLREKWGEKARELGLKVNGLKEETTDRVPENGGNDSAYIEKGEGREEGGTNPKEKDLPDLPFTQSHSKKAKGGDGMGEEIKEEASSTRLLRDLLLRVGGLSEDTIDRICSFHDESPEEYEYNPYRLIDLLEAYGVKAQKARFIVSQYMRVLHGVPMGYYPTWYGWEGAQGAVCPMPYPPSPYGVPRNPNKEEEEVDLDKYMKRLLQAQTIATLRQQNQPFPWMMPWVSVKLEPVLDSSGKVVKDEFGNPVYRTVTMPMISPEGLSGASKGETKGGSIAEEIAKMEKQRADQLEQRYLTLLETTSKARIEELEKRLEALASRNPLEDAVDMVEQLKKLGLVGNTGNLDIEKLKLDLEKWRHEQEIAMEKWREEMKMRREEREEGRERMKVFGETIKEGIVRMGAPLAQAFADGYRAGTGVTPKTSSTATPQKPISEMSVEELQKLKQELEARLQKAPEIVKKTEELLKEVTAQLEAKTKQG